jgi:hypothetical protein
VLDRFFFPEGLEATAHNNALFQLAQVVRFQPAVQFGQPGENRLQQLSPAVLVVVEQSNLLQDFAIQVLCVIHDERRRAVFQGGKFNYRLRAAIRDQGTSTDSSGRSNTDAQKAS